MPDGIEIRPARPEDLADITRITQAAYSQYLPVLGSPPLPMTEDYVPRIELGEVWVGRQGGTAVGLIVLERQADHAMIFSVAVLPECHGRGYGPSLLRFAEEQAREWGLSEVRLYTNALMTRNIALYGALGYRETERRSHPLRPGFVVVDMAKRVDVV